MCADKSCGRKFTDLDDLNVRPRPGAVACGGSPLPGQDTVSVREAFAAEAPRTDGVGRTTPIPHRERVAGKAGKTHMCASINDYYIPTHQGAAHLLTVLAIRTCGIVDGAQMLACHRRKLRHGCARSRTPAMSRPWSSTKRAARRPPSTLGPPLLFSTPPTPPGIYDQLARPAPESQTLLLRAAERVLGEIWEPAPPPCCGCWSAYGQTSLTRYPRGDSSAACLSNAGGSHSSQRLGSCETDRSPGDVIMHGACKGRDAHRAGTYFRLRTL